MCEVQAAVEVASLFDQLGVPALLALALFWMGYLYLMERRKNDAMQERLLVETMANTKQMLEAVNDVTTATNSFRSTLETLRPYLGPRE